MCAADVRAAAAAAQADAAAGSAHAPAGLLIAATHSGAGKTVTTLALLAALRRRGLRVQAGKAGPDFIDPTHHARVTGRPSCNLDTWMGGESALPRILDACRADAPDAVIIEGVMGLHDGAGNGAGSSADVARVLELPVLLLIDVRGMAQSAAAVAEGFLQHCPRGAEGETLPPPRFAGIVCTHAGGPAHAALLREACAALPVPLLGILPRAGAPHIASRHLGLVMADEVDFSPARLDSMADWLEQHMDVDALLARMRAMPMRPYVQPPAPRPRGEHARRTASTAGTKSSACSAAAAGTVAEILACPAASGAGTETPACSAAVATGTGTSASTDASAAGIKSSADAAAATGAEILACPAAAVTGAEISACSAAVAAGAPPLPRRAGRSKLAFSPAARPRVAVARDAAFCFCYADLPALLETLGAEPVFFSPLTDSSLPPDCRAVYLTGGYPELHAAALAANTAMRDSLRRFAADGGRMHGECGGYMYLMHSVALPDGQTFPLCGCLPLSCGLDTERPALGYREVRPWAAQSPLAAPQRPPAARLQPRRSAAQAEHICPTPATAARAAYTGVPFSCWRGHEFHYSRLQNTIMPPDCRPLWRVADRTGAPLPDEGCVRGKVSGSWVHLYPAGSEDFWRQLICGELPH